MNLLFITYQGDVAGSTNSIEYLARGLAKIGHNVYVGCRDTSLLWSNLIESDVILIPMTFKSKMDLQNIRQIKNAVKQFDIHIINAQSSKDRYTSIFARWIYQLPVKVVHTRRQISKSCGGIQSWFYQQGTDKIIAVSQGVKDSLHRNGIGNDHIEIIYNGTPASKYSKLSNLKNIDLVEKYNISEEDFVIGCVSRRKSQEQLLQAIADLSYKVKLIFIGIEPSDKDKEIIAQSKIQHNIFFEGLMDIDEVLEHYNLFDVCILPSIMEGLSQSLLEAMRLRVPVIATAAAGNLDLINHQENGLLYENGNIQKLIECITTIRNRSIDIDKMVEQAFFNASNNFSQENTIKNHESFFFNLLLEKSRDSIWALDT